MKKGNYNHSHVVSHTVIFIVLVVATLVIYFAAQHKEEPINSKGTASENEVINSMVSQIVSAPELSEAERADLQYPTEGEAPSEDEADAMGASVKSY